METKAEFFKVILPQLMYRINIILIKISTELLSNMTADSDIYMEKEENPRHLSIFIEGETWSDTEMTETNDETIVIEIKLFWYREEKKGHWTKRRAQKDPRVYGNLIHDRGDNADRWWTENWE